MLIATTYKDSEVAVDINEAKNGATVSAMFYTVNISKEPVSILLSGGSYQIQDL